MSFKELLTDSLTVTGLNYKTHPTFGQLTLTKDIIDTIYQTQTDNTDYLILNTCNRIEIWSYNQNQSFFQTHLHIHPHYYLKGEQAWDWMCRVTSGLESEVIGEEEISGQVRSMFKERKPYLKKMESILNSVIWMSRKIRNDTKPPKTIGEGVYDYLKNSIKDIHLKKIIVIGMGMVGKDVLKTLTNLNPETLVGINRTPLEGQLHGIDDIQKWLGLYHIIIICTNSPDPILHQKDWLDKVIIDLSRPRNTTGDDVILLEDINSIRV
jgi:glutamyl-tRNA reductase